MTLRKELNRNAPYLEIGQYIHQCRSERGVSLLHLSVRLGVNPSYLREVERGERVPNDQFIRSLTEICNLDENYIFSLLGKAPLIAREELDHHSILQETLKVIGMSALSEQQKEELYQQFSIVVEAALTEDK